MLSPAWMSRPLKKDIIKCIACKKCEERCPNDAIKVKEVWNFQEIIKLLSDSIS